MFESGGRQRDAKLLTVKEQETSADVQAALSSLENAVLSLQEQVNDAQGKIYALIRPCQNVFDMVKTLKDEQEKHWVSNQTRLDEHAVQIESCSNKSDQEKDKMSMQRDVDALKSQFNDKLSVCSSVQNELASLVIRLDDLEAKQHFQQNMEDAARQLVDSLVMPRLENLKQSIQDLEIRQQHSSANDLTKPAERDTRIIGKSQDSAWSPPPTSNMDVNVNCKHDVEVAPKFSLSPRCEDHRDVASSQQDDLAQGPANPNDVDYCNKDEYIFQSSIWDCMILVGIPSVGLLGSAFIVFGTALNIALQIMFTLIVYANMTSESVGEHTVLAAKEWRTIIAHDIMWADTLSHTSLVRHLCNGNEALQFSASQKILRSSIDPYLHPDKAGFENLDGSVLANLALIVFLLTIFQELSHILEVSWYVCLSAAEGTTHMRSCIESPDNGDSLRIVLGRRESAMFLLLSTMPRLVVAVMLCYVGVKFLSYTIDVSELLFNVLALTFVFDIDEVLFKVVIPTRIQRCLELLDPWTVPSSVHMNRVVNNVTILTRLSAIAVIVVLADVLIVLPQKRTLQDINTWLCGGDLDFVYTVNRASDLVYYTKSVNEFDPEFAAPWNAELAKKAVLRLTELTPLEDGHLGVDEAAWDEVQSLSVSNIESAAGKLKCMDHLGGTYEAISMAGVQPEYNTKPSKHYRRFMCPPVVDVTVPCRDPLYDVLFAASMYSLYNNKTLAIFRSMQEQILFVDARPINTTELQSKRQRLKAHAKMLRAGNTTDFEGLLQYWELDQASQNFVMGSAEYYEEFADALRTDAACAGVSFTLCLTSAAVRTICQIRCGCANPQIGNPIATSREGCSQQCGQEYLERIVKLEFAGNFTASQCTDKGPNALQNDSIWRNYTDGFLKAFTQVKVPFTQCVDRDIIWNMYQIDVCAIGQRWRSIRPWCARTCDCHANSASDTFAEQFDKSECPSQCKPLLRYRFADTPKTARTVLGRTYIKHDGYITGLGGRRLLLLTTTIENATQTCDNLHGCMGFTVFGNPVATSSMQSFVTAFYNVWALNPHQVYKSYSAIEPVSNMQVRDLLSSGTGLTNRSR